MKKKKVKIKRRIKPVSDEILPVYFVFRYKTSSTSTVNFSVFVGTLYQGNFGHLTNTSEVYRDFLEKMSKYGVPGGIHFEYDESGSSDRFLYFGMVNPLISEEWHYSEVDDG